MHKHYIKWPEQSLNQRPLGYWPNAYDHWAMFSTEYYSIAKTYIIYSHTLHNLIIQTIINTDHLSLNNKQILGGSSLNHTYRTKKYLLSEERKNLQCNYIWQKEVSFSAELTKGSENNTSICSFTICALCVDDTSPPLGISWLLPLLVAIFTSYPSCNCLATNFLVVKGIKHNYYSHTTKATTDQSKS